MNDVVRKPNGQFAPGSSGGRSGGRKAKARSADEILINEFAAKVATRDGKVLDKARATARQIANEGATGKQARLAMAALQKAEDRARVTAAPEPTMTANDQAIFDRFLQHVRKTLMAELTQPSEIDPADDQPV